MAEIVARTSDRLKAKHQEKVSLSFQQCRPAEKKMTTVYNDTFRYDQLAVTKVTKSRCKAGQSSASTFGKVFADHMFEVEWNADAGWGRPQIVPLHELAIHPACKVLHYASECFEGLKAHRGSDDRIRLFRPELHMQRFVKSAERCALPSFDWRQLLNCIVELIRLDRQWVPADSSDALYIRPTFIGIEATLGVGISNRCLLYAISSPCGVYLNISTSLSLYADPDITRAWPGGSACVKIGANYAPCLIHDQTAKRYKCQQVLWLFGDDQRLTEAGSMNLFIYWINERGKLELATPPSDGLILPGVTRQSILEICRDWGEFDVSERVLTMGHLADAYATNRIVEVFGSGTAAVICSVGRVVYRVKGVTTVYELPNTEFHEQRKISSRLKTQIQKIKDGDSGKWNWTLLV